MLRKLFTLIVCLVATIATTSAQTPPRNEIWFTTVDGRAPAFFENNNFSSILTYENNMWVIRFDDSIDTNYIISNAFRSCNLNSITIGNSVTEIGEDAFKWCSGLTSITIPNSVKKIGSSAFEGCSGLMSIIIPNSVTYIGDSAFEGCSGLTSITIPSSSIGLWAFKGCSGELIINGNISAYHAFNESNFSRVIIGNGVTYLGGSAFEDCKWLESITIPNSVEEIGYSAFEGCSGLTSITIPNSVKKIGSSVFEGCKWLESVTIGNGVTYIGDSAFKGCNYIESVTISNGYCYDYFNGKVSKVLLNSEYTSQDGRCLIVDGTLEVCLLTGLRKYDIPEGITKIESCAFVDCSSITDITIPNSVKEIGSSAFRGCKWLKSITIPNSVEEIGYSAFEGCSGLTSITIPNSVKEIGSNAFEGCTSLTSIEIPNSVKEIGTHAFSDCTSLTSATINSGVIQSYAFFKCDNLTSVTIGSGVTSIGEEAFWYCENLTSVTIGSGVTEIGKDAFYECSKLKSIKVANSKCYDILTQSGVSVSAFTGSNASSDGRCLIVDGELRRFIGENRWEYVIPQNVTSISNRVFKNCRNLRHITIPSGVTSIGDQQFSGYLIDITCLATTPPQISNLNIDETTMIYVPKEAIKKYKKDPNWKKYKKQIKKIKKTK